MKIFSDIKDFSWTFEKPENDQGRLLHKDGKPISYSFIPIGNNRYTFILDGTSHLIHIIKENSIYHVHLEGEYFPVKVEDERIREIKKLVEHSEENQGQEIVTAPIPGLISKILVNQGDTVNQGGSLIILEAMKMENELKSPVNGTIKKILIQQGGSVDKDQPLLVIESGFLPDR